MTEVHSRQLEVDGGSEDGYDPYMDQTRRDMAFNQIESAIWYNSIAWWVLLPISVVFLYSFQVLPMSHATCGTGLCRWEAIPVVAMVSHTLWAESRAWHCMRSLLAPPEWTILRQLGVLRKRSWFLCLGIMEGLDLFTDLVFPLVARACDQELTHRWAISWSLVPHVGIQAASLVHTLRFWGVAIAVCGVNLFSGGILGILEVRREERFRQMAVRGMDHDPHEFPRIGAEVFYAWARSSTTAMLPSVMVLSEAMAEQRRFVFDDTPEYKDSGLATFLRQQLALGNVTYAAVRDSQVISDAEHELARTARDRYHSRIIIVKVFLGNVLSLWLQSSYFGLTFGEHTTLARQQVIVSMMVSAGTMLVRCWRVCFKLGAAGQLFLFFNLFFLCWTGAKVYFAYQCPDHLWNLTTGCVDLKDARY